MLHATPADQLVLAVKANPQASIKTLLENARVVRWLARFERDYLEQLQLIAEPEHLPIEQVPSSRFRHEGRRHRQ
jgi:hypothetical protein